jgi:methylmalonic acid semialdehyde dehydrogenase
MTTSNAIPTVKLLIDGEFIESTTQEWRDVVNPATQEVLARVPFATAEEIDRAVASGQKAFKTWRKTPIGARARIFLKYQQLIRENMKELAAILTAEQGKTLADAEGDVFRGLEVVEHAAGIGNLQLGELANNVAAGVDTYTLLQPLGVCAGITPFNFPAMIPLWMFPMAIATGNTFVLKPSEQDPMVTMRLCELALEAGVPPGVLNVVHGGADAVNAICDHPDIKAVSFVGSTKVGTHVYNRASQAGKRVQCMMGAKNHAIVLPDAHKEQTLNNLAGAAFGAAGQRCMALSVVVLVGEAQAWIPDLVAKAQTRQGQRRCRGRHRCRPAGFLRGAGSRQRADRTRRTRRRQAGAGRPQPERQRLRKGQLRRPDDLLRRHPRDEHLSGRNLRPGPVRHGGGDHGRSHRADQRQPERQRHRHLHPLRRGGAALPGRDRRGSGGHQRTDPGAGTDVLLHRLARFQARRPRPYGKQVVQFYTQTKTITERWFDENEVGGPVNTTINLK